MSFCRCGPSHSSGTEVLLDFSDTVSCVYPLIWSAWPGSCSLFTSLVPLPVHILQLCLILSTQLFSLQCVTFKNNHTPIMALTLPLHSYFHACVSNLAFFPDLSLVLKINLHVFTSTYMKFNLISTAKWFSLLFIGTRSSNFSFSSSSTVFFGYLSLSSQPSLIHKMVNRYLNAKFLKSCFQKANIKDADKTLYLKVLTELWMGFTFINVRKIIFFDIKIIKNSNFSSFNRDHIFW